MNSLAKCRAFLGVYYAYILEYRAEIFFWMLTGSLPLIMMGVWMQAGSLGDFGISSVDFGRYFLAVFLARQATFVWVIWEFEEDVVQGTLSPRLLQPVDPAWHYVAGHVAERFARMPLAAGLLALFFVLYPECFWVPSLGQIAAFVCVLTVVFTLRFLIQYTFAMAAFWLERAVAIEQIFWLAYLVLSGLLAPLEVFPAAVREFALLTPFPYFVHFPAQILVGGEVNGAKAALVVGAWLVFFLILNRFLWRRGLARYSAMGA